MAGNSEAEVPGSGQLADHSLKTEDREPKSASEKYLASLWLEIIGLDQLTLTDKFLDVGGNSLTLNIILNRIEKETGVALKPQLFFDTEKSSLFELARELDVSREDKPDRSQQTAPALECA